MVKAPTAPRQGEVGGCCLKRWIVRRPVVELKSFVAPIADPVCDSGDVYDYKPEPLAEGKVV